MIKEQTDGRVAQPADEELKKHGDKLGKEVRDVATESPAKNNEDKEKKGSSGQEG